MFPNHLTWTKNFCFGYIALTCFFEIFPRLVARWLVGNGDFNENPVVHVDLDFDLGFVNILNMLPTWYTEENHGVKYWNGWKKWIARKQHPMCLKKSNRCGKSYTKENERRKIDCIAKRGKLGDIKNFACISQHELPILLQQKVQGKIIHLHQDLFHFFS